MEQWRKIKNKQIKVQKKDRKNYEKLEIKERIETIKELIKTKKERIKAIKQEIKDQKQFIKTLKKSV